eukprot:COSAG04_NODE_7463_length_1124_cov_1.706341_1_plen_292_part_00
MGCLAAYVDFVDDDEDGRIDLLGCNVAEGVEGEAFVAALEKEYSCNFAASSDLTSMKDGGDMILETDDIDVTAIYFDQAKLHKWDGELPRHHWTTAGFSQPGKKINVRRYGREIPGAKTGDVLVAKLYNRGGVSSYMHYALYTESRKHKAVIYEFSKEKNRVTATRFSKWKKGYLSGDVILVKKRDMANPTFSARNIIKQANKKLGDASRGKYHLLRNNCEHYVNWCLTGKKRSDQVNGAAYHAAMNLLCGRWPYGIFDGYVFCRHAAVISMLIDVVQTSRCPERRGEPRL